VTVLLNAIGVDKVTSPTSKDEYHRVFRTALTMREENVWLVPLLDEKCDPAIHRAFLSLDRITDPVDRRSAIRSVIFQ
jgi:hypothetical protein